MATPAPLPPVDGPALAWSMQNPQGLARAIAALNAMLNAASTAERELKRLAKPRTYTDTAGASYSQSDTQLIMDQLELLTKAHRDLLTALTTILANLATK